MIQHFLHKIGAIRLPERPYQEAITREDVEEILGTRPRRICFASSHANALKATPQKPWAGNFSVPFTNTVYPIFHQQTGLDLYKSKAGLDRWWRSIRSQEEFGQVSDWIERCGRMVFLRDTLALSVALSEAREQNLEDYSPIGELEHTAKYDQDQEAIDELTELVANAVSTLPFYKDTKWIASVPPRKDKPFDLPSEICSRLQKLGQKQNLTSAMDWAGDKGSLKNSALTEKWTQLEEAKLVVQSEHCTGKTLILLDDLYQSGITMQFVASKLLEAGVKQVFGISIVKAMRDTDNG